MARFYGSNSGYLIKSDLKYFFYATLFVLLPLIGIWVALKVFSSGAIPFIAILLIVFVVSISQPFIDLFAGKSNKFYRGWGGELDIKRELSKLPDGFSVFQDLALGHNKGNLDFVVVGPTGIFLLEVKSHSGRISFDGFELTLNDRRFRDKNILRQVHGQTYALKSYLNQQAGADVYIHSVLVFSSKYASLRFGLKPLQNVYIIQKKYLLSLLCQAPECHYPVPRENIEAVLTQALK